MVRGALQISEQIRPYKARVYGTYPLLQTKYVTGAQLLLEIVYDLLKRPENTYASLADQDPGRPALDRAIVEEVEISIKYEGYIQRQLREVEAFSKLERRRIPPDIDYEAVPGLRTEARQKLAAIRPVSFGQASRISGVSPADLTALMIWTEKEK